MAKKTTEGKTAKKKSVEESDVKKKKTKKASEPKKKRLTKAEKEAQEESKKLYEKWVELRELSEGQPAKKYRITENFEANTAMDHPKLGWGYVLTSQNNRLEVLFEEGIKVLVSNYEG